MLHINDVLAALGYTSEEEQEAIVYLLLLAGCFHRDQFLADLRQAGVSIEAALQLSNELNHTLANAATGESMPAIIISCLSQTTKSDFISLRSAGIWLQIAVQKLHKQCSDTQTAMTLEQRWLNGLIDHTVTISLGGSLSWVHESREQVRHALSILNSLCTQQETTAHEKNTGATQQMCDQILNDLTTLFGNITQKIAVLKDKLPESESDSDLTEIHASHNLASSTYSKTIPVLALTGVATIGFFAWQIKRSSEGAAEILARTLALPSI